MAKRKKATNPEREHLSRVGRSNSEIAREARRSKRQKAGGNRNPAADVVEEMEDADDLRTQKVSGRNKRMPT